MRIKSIILKNYRQFRDVTINLSKDHDRDLQVFIGKNGTGKTNILNAINWCLYGDEPHLSKDSELLPFLNVNSIRELNDGDEQKGTVEVYAESDDGESVIYKREATFKVYEGGHKLVHKETEFEVIAPGEQGNKEILENEDADSYVERFVPRTIREYFFFDGERLDSYFKEAARQKIRHAIFEISQLDLLDKVSDKITQLLRDFRREASKENPLTDETRRQLEDAEDRHSGLEDRIVECNDQITLAKEKIFDYTEKLAGLPKIEDLEKRRAELKDNQKLKNALLKSKTKEKQGLLFDYGQIIFLWPALNRSLQVLEEKIKNREIPPLIDQSVLDNILKDHKCTICGRHLDNGAEQHVKSLLSQIKLSPEAIQSLMQLTIPLHQFNDKIDNFKKDTQAVTKEIDGYKKDLDDIEKELNSIDRDVGGYDVDTIKEWKTQRKSYEDSLDQNHDSLSNLKAGREHAAKEIIELRERLDRELNKVERFRALKKQIDFCESALAAVLETKEYMMYETREQIEAKTKSLFLALTWKKETFKGVEIDEGYGLHLIHQDGFESLGSLSAGERELLALAFTLALHQVSGFDSPILIDTPVSRIDEPRKNFARIFSEVSLSKQTILLFNLREYSEDVSDVLDKVASNRYVTRSSKDERETTIEVL